MTRHDHDGIDWEAALARHERWLRTVVFARVGEAQATEDVMQEVRLAAIDPKKPLADPSKVAPWLYQIAVRQALMYRRKQGRQRKLVDRYAQTFRPEERNCRERDPLDWLLCEEERELVRAALDRLARRDREILLLKYTEDWSYRQIADRLGVSKSAVEARLHRARGRLRTELTHNLKLIASNLRES